MHPTPSETPPIEPSALRRALHTSGAAMAFTRGTSMRPLITQGLTYVAVRRLDGEPAPGDLLLFEDLRAGGTATLLHRFVGSEGGFYITRGDNRSGCERVAPGHVLGRATDIFWRGEGSLRLRTNLWLPRLLGACPDGAGGNLRLGVDSPGFRRYSRALPLVRGIYRPLHFLRRCIGAARYKLITLCRARKR